MVLEYIIQYYSLLEPLDMLDFKDDIRMVDVD